jgi:hypothetical protein
MRVRKEKGTRMGLGHRDGKDNRIGTTMGKGQVYDRDKMGKGRARDNVGTGTWRGLRGG